MRVRTGERSAGDGTVVCEEEYDEGDEGVMRKEGDVLSCARVF